MPYDVAKLTIRGMLDRVVGTKEIWTAAIAGRPNPGDGDASIEGLCARLESAGPEFVEIVRGIRDRDEWDTSFVDALCEPAQTFSFGGMLAHVLTFSAYRRQALVSPMRAIGVDDVGTGDPFEWERSLA